MPWNRQKHKARRPYAIIIICVVITLFVNACYAIYTEGRKLSRKKYNVLFLNIELLRADHVGLINPDSDCTPNIDEFFKDSIIFEQASAPSGRTFNSYHAVVTAKEAVEIKKKKDPTLFRYAIATILLNEGYNTININEGQWTGRSVLLDKGFLSYRECYGKRPISRSLDVLYEELEQALGQTKDKPFFLLYHPTTLHYPYPYPLNREVTYRSNFLKLSKQKTHLLIKYRIPYGQRPKVLAGPFEINNDNDLLYKISFDGEVFDLYQKDLEAIRMLYAQQVRYIDDELLPLFKMLEKDFAKDTIIVFYANHGEGLGDQGVFSHGVLYESCVHVPLLIKHPQINEQIRIKSPVSLVDLVPGIYDMLGINMPKHVSGVSLVPLIENGKYERQYIYGQTRQYEYIRKGDWKLIVTASKIMELYNIAADPYEQNNVYSKYPQIAAELRAQLRKKNIELRSKLKRREWFRINL